MKLAKFLTSNQLFALLAPEKVVPSTVGYMPPEGDSIMGAFAKAAENGFAPNHLDLPTEVNLKFQQDWFPGVMLNKWTPQEAAELLQKAYEDERKKAEAEQK